MKKSKAINIINDHIEDAIGNYVYGGKCKSKLFAKKILRALEDSGMRPPKYKIILYAESGYGNDRNEPYGYSYKEGWE